MLSERLRTEAQPRTKNGQPAHRHHWRREQKLNPRRRLRRNVAMKVEDRNVRAHFQDDDRHRQRDADPEAPRVMSINSALGPVSAAGAQRFQRHAADRAGAWADLPDLRMHRTGIDRAVRRRLRRAAWRPLYSNISRDRRRICCGSRRCRKIIATFVACDDAASWPDRPSSRIPDRWPCRRHRACACAECFMCDISLETDTR